MAEAVSSLKVGQRFTVLADADDELLAFQDTVWVVVYVGLCVFRSVADDESDRVFNASVDLMVEVVT